MRTPIPRGYRRSWKCVECKIPASFYTVSSVDYQNDWICSECLDKMNDEEIDVVDDACEA